jgi:hypothetical protein
MHPLLFASPTTPENFPCWHCMHCVLLDSPSADEYLPALHSAQTVSPLVAP